MKILFSKAIISLSCFKIAFCGSNKKINQQKNHPSNHNVQIDGMLWVKNNAVYHPLHHIIKIDRWGMFPYHLQGLGGKLMAYWAFFPHYVVGSGYYKPSNCWYYKPSINSYQFIVPGIVIALHFLIHKFRFRS